FGADRGTDVPAAKDAFANHAGLLHHARRRRIVDVAERPGTPDLGFGERPVDERAKRLGGEPFAPVRPTEDVAEPSAISPEVYADRADEIAGLAGKEEPWAVASGLRLPTLRASGEELGERLDLVVCLPREVARHLEIVRVRGERERRVGDAR